MEMWLLTFRRGYLYENFPAVVQSYIPQSLERSFPIFMWGKSPIMVQIEGNERELALPLVYAVSTRNSMGVLSIVNFKVLLRT